MITKRQTYADDRKVQQQPNYGVKKWMEEVVIGYSKLKEIPKLTLKKYENGDLEIYDGTKLLGSYTAVGNIYWGEQDKAGTDIYQNYRNLKNNPNAKNLANKIDESYFNVEEVAYSDQERERNYLDARGKMSEKIRAYHKYYSETRKTPSVYIDGAMKNISANELQEYVLYNFPNQFNKYGLRLAEWVLDGLISDKRNIIKLRLLAALNELVKVDDSKYDEKFNGLSPQDIIDEYAMAVKASIRKEKEKIEQMPVEDKGYKIVRIRDYDHATSFAKYFKGSGDTWCVTTDRGMYNRYIDPMAGKSEVFYALLAPNFENMKKPVPPKGDRYDSNYASYVHPDTGEIYPATIDGEYAKSMIMVGVRQDGSIRQSTSRLNHSLGGNVGDLSYSPYELSKIIGMSIYKACPPLTSPLDLLREIKVKGLTYLKANSVSGKKEVKFYGDAFYIIENGKLMTDAWDYILRFDTITTIRKKPGDQTSPIIGYVFVQKLVNEDELMDDTTEDFFIGMDVNLNILYGPTKKGNIFSAIKETRKIINEVTQ